ncbi:MULTISPECIES: ABC transporter permease [Haloarcula]|uniref:ABC transporter permease n=1 Tax=Haloarcula TaxID=2237 RepID=UPI0023E81300|nr:ABC transporter permease subunit [Halomicroarcula sp. SHR3]
MSGSDETSPAGKQLQQADRALHDRFNWYPVAKKDFKDALRSKGLWVLAAIFTVLFVAPIAVRLYFEGIGPSPPDGGLSTRFVIEGIYLDLVTVVLPIVTIFVGVAAITKEKTSGSLKLLLSLPFSRRSVIIGKVVGRGAVVAVPFLIAASITALFMILSDLSLNLEMYTMFVLFSLLFVVVMVAIAVSISGAVSTTLRSIIVNAIFYVYVTFGWNSFANGVGKFLYNDVGLSRSLRWNTVLFLKMASPTQAYKTLVNSMLASFSDDVQPRLQQFAEQWDLSLSQLGPQQYSRYNLFDTQGSLFSAGLPDEDKRVLCESVSGGTYENATVAANNQTNTVTVTTSEQTQTFQNVGNITANETQAQAFCTAGGGDLPFYFSDPAVVLFMLGWIALAAGLSYYTFDLVDL